MQVVPTKTLPMIPSDGENARRIVRHAFWNARKERGEQAYFADSLGPVGPYPYEPIHAYAVRDQFLLCSWSFYKRLKEESHRFRIDLRDDPLARLLEASIPPPHDFTPVEVKNLLAEMDVEHDRQLRMTRTMRLETLVGYGVVGPRPTIISGLIV